MNKKQAMNDKKAAGKVKAASSFSLDERHTLLLDALSWLYYARADQLTRLYYLPGSWSLVQSRLKYLETAGMKTAKGEEKKEQGFITHLSIMSNGKNTSYIYTLTGRGVKFLKDAERIPKDRYFRPSDIERSAFFLPHTLDVGDCMIAFEILAREDNRFQVVARRHEIDIRREKREEATRVCILKTVGDKVIEKWLSIYPDGFILLSIRDDDGRVHKSGIWLEIDRNTSKDNADFKDRIRGIYEYYFTKGTDENGKKILKSSDAYIEKYGTKSLIVAYLVTEGGEQRMQHLCNLAKTELASTNERATVARIFRFAVAPPSWDYLDPATKTGRPIDVVRNLLFTPIWQVPFEGHELMPLLRIT